jgi:hypothetical protein
MTTTQDPIAHAARLLREAAEELRQAHTYPRSEDWGRETDAKAAYDEHMAAAQALEDWEAAVGAGGVQALSAAPVGAGGVQALSAAPVAFLKSVIALCSHRGYSPANIEVWDKDDKWIADLWRQAESMLTASPTPPAEQQAATKAAPGEPDGFGSAEHWKEKAQYWAGVAHRLRGEALRGEPVDGIVHPPAPQQEAQEPTTVDQKTMEIAESVGLIGPASRVGDLHAAIQRFHDLICVNATIKAAVMAADVIRGVATPARDYPPLPMQFACSGMFPVYSADQMRAYVDADRAAYAPASSQPAPAPLSDDVVKDAARWRWLSEHIGVAWNEGKFTSLVRIVSDKNRTALNASIDRMMAGDWSYAALATQGGE